MDKIILLDPAILSNGTPSLNLGDLIIQESVISVIKELYPNDEIVSISTHSPFYKKEKDIINNAKKVFVGGTNIVTSNICAFNRLVPEHKKFFYAFPGFENVVLLGAGWSNYQKQMDWRTKIYYSRILSNKHLHSMRDEYSTNKLNESLCLKGIHTSCPTTWSLSNFNRYSFQYSCKNILMTLTDYDKNVNKDSKLIEDIFSIATDKVYFFCQGSNDYDYLKSLQIYQSNKDKFSIIPHIYKEFYDFQENVTHNYIGTRLHCGIKSMQKNNFSLIVSIDNRAQEIANSIGLNIINRGERINDLYLNNVNQKLNIPVLNINKWKAQFK